METNFTTEMLTTLYDRAMTYARNRYGMEPDRVEIDESGYINVVEETYRCGDYETESNIIDPENLNNMDLDRLKKEREDELEKQRVAREERQKKEAQEREKNAIEQRRKQYEALKKEFGS